MRSAQFLFFIIVLSVIVSALTMEEMNQILDKKFEEHNIPLEQRLKIRERLAYELKQGNLDRETLLRKIDEFEKSLAAETMPLIESTETQQVREPLDKSKPLDEPLTRAPLTEPKPYQEKPIEPVINHNPAESPNRVFYDFEQTDEPQEPTKILSPEEIAIEQARVKQGLLEKQQANSEERPEHSDIQKEEIQKRIQLNTKQRIEQKIADKKLAIKEEELTKLKITREKLADGIAKLKQVQALEKKGRVEEAQKIRDQFKDRIPEIKERAKKERALKFEEQKQKFSEKAKAHVQRLEQKKRKLDVRVKRTSFDITLNEETVTKTEFVYTVEPNSSLAGAGELIVEIPKEVAQKASWISFDPQPEILVEDPVIKWAFKNVPQDSAAEYSFTVDGEAQDFDTLAAAAADDPGFIQTLFYWIKGLF